LNNAVLFSTYATFEDLFFPRFWKITRINVMFIKSYFLFIFNK